MNKNLKCDINIKLIFIAMIQDNPKNLHKIRSKNKWGTMSFINRSIGAFNKISSPMKKSKKHKIIQEKIKTYIF